jgi:hypothetical protein
MHQALVHTDAAWLGAEEASLRGNVLFHILYGIAWASDATCDRIIEHRQVIVAVTHGAGAL